MRGPDEDTPTKTAATMPPATWTERVVMGVGMVVFVLAVNALWWGTICLGLALMGTALLLYRRRVGALWRWNEKPANQPDDRS